MTAPNSPNITAEFRTVALFGSESVAMLRTYPHLQFTCLLNGSVVSRSVDKLDIDFTGPTYCWSGSKNDCLNVSFMFFFHSLSHEMLCTASEIPVTAELVYG